MTAASIGRTSRCTVTCVLVVLALLPLTALAQHPRVALVIGNGAYTAQSPSPVCITAARAVAEKLRAAAYDVVDRNDLTTGGFDGAMGEFSSRLMRSPGATAFVYVCTRGASLNDRAFLLPVSATLERPTDLFTQGVLAKSLYDSLERGAAGTVVVALDIVSPNSAPRVTGFDTIAEASGLVGLGAITIIGPGSNTVITPLAQALVTILARPIADNAALISGAKEELANAPSAALVAVARHPSKIGLVVGEPPAPPRSTAEATPPPASAPQTAPPASSSSPPLAATPAPSPAPAVATPSPMPEEHLMTFEDRRRVQEALRSLGYYTIAVDGVFGSETRAAIRKYQMQLMAPPTGRLTPEQAGLLVLGR